MIILAISLEKRSVCHFTRHFHDVVKTENQINQTVLVKLVEATGKCRLCIHIQNTLVRISQLAEAEAVVGGCIVEPDGCHLKNAQSAG